VRRSGRSAQGLRIGGLLVILAATSIGCEGAPTVPLTRWEVQTPGGVRREVDLPAAFEDALGPGVPSYSLTTKVPLPPSLEGRDLVLAVPFLRAHAALFVDDQPAIVLDPRQASTGRVRFLIPHGFWPSGEATLRLDVVHHGAGTARVDTIPSLADAQSVGGFPAFVAELDRTTGFFALASSLFSFMLFGTVAFARRRAEERHFGWLSLQALASVAYPAYVLGLLDAPLGDSAALVMLAFVATSGVLGIRFLHAELRLGPVSRLWEVALGVVWALALVQGERDTVAPVAGALVGAALAYQLLRAGSVAYRTRSSVAAALGASWLAMCVFGLTDVFGWMGFGELLGGLRTGCLGMSLAAFLQSIVLTAHYVRSVRDADALNAELAKRLEALESNAREITLLDKELRHQVAARAEGFAKVLARMGPTTPEPPAAPDLPVGFILESRYRLGPSLGEGGMGRVYEATRIEDGEAVAIKVLTSTRIGQDLARFAREAELAGKIRHPHVVQILDVDVAKSGFFYIVMELVRGVSLRDERARWGEPRWAIPILSQIAYGLSAIHAAGVVHRDLKPANVLLEDATGGHPRVRIADFGVSGLAPEEALAGPTPSRVRETSAPDEPTRPIRPNVPVLHDSHASGSDSADTRLTRVGMVLGTPRYVAPEVARQGARAATRASDVFALGVIAYEILTGEPPFTEDEVRGLFRRHDYPAPPPLTDKVPSLAPQIASLVQACLATDPAARPSADELSTIFAAEMPLSA